MNENLYLRYLIDQQRRADLMRRADRERLVRAANPTKPSRYDAAVAFVGGLLIAVGQGLQTRYGAALPETPSPLAPTHDATC